MTDATLPLALHTAHSRIRAEFLKDHLNGNIGEMLDELDPFVGHLIHEAQEINLGLRPNPYTGVTNSPEDVTTLHVITGMFLVGRAYEEIGLMEISNSGELDHLCTVCGGDKSKIKVPRKRPPAK